MLNKSNNVSPKIDFYKNSVVGIFAGTIEVILLQPILFCKNASQQKLKFTINPRILYRGVTMSATNMAVLTGIQFPLTNFISKSILKGENRLPTEKEQMSSAFGGGIISGLVCAPMELIIIQQQRWGGNIIKTPTRIISKYGTKNLMRGLTMSMGREGVFTAGYLGMAPLFSQYFL